MDRRTFLTATGATTAGVALAGCTNFAGLGGGGASDGDGDGSGTGGGGASGTGSDGGDAAVRGGGADDEFDPFELEATIDDDDVAEGVRVVSSAAFETEDGVGVTGAVENVSDRTLRSIEVEVRLRDETETPVGTYDDVSSEDVDAIPPDNRWRFWVTFDEEEVRESTGYTVSVDTMWLIDADRETATDASTDAGTGAGTETTSG